MDTGYIRGGILNPDGIVKRRFICCALWRSPIRDMYDCRVRRRRATGNIHSYIQRGTHLSLGDRPPPQPQMIHGHSHTIIIKFSRFYVVQEQERETKRGVVRVNVLATHLSQLLECMLTGRGGGWVSNVVLWRLHCGLWLGDQSILPIRIRDHQRRPTISLHPFAWYILFVRCSCV